MRIIVLFGQDQLRLREWTGQLIEVLNHRYGEIQQFDFDGIEVEPAVLLDELRSYGLLQQHKLVVLNKADQFLANKNEDDEMVSPGGRHRTTRQLMEAYAATPVEDATLLMKADTWRKSKLDGLIKKVGVIGKFDPPNESEAVAWIIEDGAKRHGVKINRNAAELLVERLGSGLDRLNTELAKLASCIGVGKTINRELVVEMVGLSREEEAWIIQEAMASGDPGNAITKLRELLEVSRHSEVPLMWAVIDLVRKLHAASSLIRQGMDDWTVARQVGIWGEAKNHILRAARQLQPDELAQLLRDAVRTDQGNKTGLGKTRRSLEVLTMRVADSIGSV